VIEEQHIKTTTNDEHAYTIPIPLSRRSRKQAAKRSFAIVKLS
jgi:hypothetical protein